MLNQAGEARCHVRQHQGSCGRPPRAAGPEALVGTLGPRLASREQGPRAQAGGGAREGRGGDVVFEAMLSLSATEGRMSRQGFAFSLNLVLILM